jgi:hypothetical protein
MNTPTFKLDRSSAAFIATLEVDSRGIACERMSGLEHQQIKELTELGG